MRTVSSVDADSLSFILSISLPLHRTADSDDYVTAINSTQRNSVAATAIFSSPLVNPVESIYYIFSGTLTL